MVKSLTITNPKGEKLLLTLTDPWSSGLAVKNIDGLGPSKGLINTTELATMDGGMFNSSRILTRQIVMTLVLMTNPDHVHTQTIENVRHHMYKFFPVKKRINVRVTTDNRDSDTYGYVESVEPTIWSEQEAVQISILCADPFLYAGGDEITVFSGVHPLFEFPFSNESLTENLIEFGDIRLDTRVTLNYSGDVDTGIHITIHAMDTAENITLYDINSREFLRVNTNVIQRITGAGLGAGDDVIISTVPGNKYARLLRNGVYTNVLAAIDKESSWFLLTPGENMFNFTAEFGEKALMVTFAYRNAYGGI